MSAAPRTILAIGEALWDVFPDGRRPGGAPCNVAFHVAQLGDRGVIVTRVGDDADGAELLAFLGARGVVTEHVQRDPRHPTGTVLVTVERGEPRYTITEDVAWDHLRAEPDTRARVHGADAVVVGSLAQRSADSRAAIRTLLAEARARAMIVFDVNLRPPFIDRNVVEATCRAASVVKMNDAEAVALADVLGRVALVPWLVDEVGVQAVCVTRGGNGATLTTRQGTLSVPGTPIDTTGGDTVGAGDAFTAAMTHQLIRGAAPEVVLRTANAYAAMVASRQGAMPSITAEDLRRAGVTPPGRSPPGGAM